MILVNYKIIVLLIGLFSSLLSTAVSIQTEVDAFIREDSSDRLSSAAV